MKSKKQASSPGGTGAKKQEKLRILSLDGGGLYGLTQALWLQQLCERNERFLEPGEIQYYGGASAGAMNALVLAAQPNPRRFVMDGHLKRFWKEPGIYTNRRNPRDRFLSNFGRTAWLGTEDYLDVLNKYFEDRTLGDLPHKVIITTYNWFGAKPVFPKGPGAEPFSGPNPFAAGNPFSRRFPFTRGYPFSEGFPFSSVGGSEASFHINKDTTTKSRQWYPRMFTNFERLRYIHESQGEEGPDQVFEGDEHTTTDDRAYLARDIAYGAAAMPTIRAIRGGVGDAGIYSANPAVDIIAGILEERKYQEEPAPLVDYLESVYGDDDPEVNEAAKVYRDLPRLTMLSVGNGSLQPWYYRRNFNFGVLPWMTLPANFPVAGHWTPSSYSLNQIIGNVTQAAEALLHGNFWRLNPMINPAPPGPIVYLVRNTFWLWLLIYQVESVMKRPESIHAVDQTVKSFLETPRWCGKP